MSHSKNRVDTVILPVNSTDGTSVPHASPASAQVLRPEKYHW
ncbi:MAG: hypothetical protein NUW37_01170 [Planctomycetes bacterium]|nr:hypothetical protein [Planctomycetota bacterium]